MLSFLFFLYLFFAFRDALVCWTVLYDEDLFMIKYLQSYKYDSVVVSNYLEKIVKIWKINGCIYVA
jgi:hypothetical protein